RLHRNGSKYVISRSDVTPYTYQESVVTVTVDSRWVDYKKACDTISAKHKIDFTWTNGTGGPEFKLEDPVTSEAAFEDFRRAMRTAIAEAYKGSDGAFGEFYNDVVKGTSLPNKTKGSIFEELVAKCAGDGVDGAAATSAIPVWDKR